MWVKKEISWIISVLTRQAQTTGLNGDSDDEKGECRSNHVPSSSISSQTWRRSPRHFNLKVTLSQVVWRVRQLPLLGSEQSVSISHHSRSNRTYRYLIVSSPIPASKTNCSRTLSSYRVVSCTSRHGVSTRAAPSCQQMALGAGPVLVPPSPSSPPCCSRPPCWQPINKR